MGRIQFNPTQSDRREREKAQKRIGHISGRAVQNSSASSRPAVFLNPPGRGFLAVPPPRHFLGTWTVLSQDHSHLKSQLFQVSALSHLPVWPI